MIVANDLERMKEIFVTRKECSETSEAFRLDFAKDKTKLAVIEHQLKVITWLITTVGGGVIAVLIKLMFGMA